MRARPAVAVVALLVAAPLLATQTVPAQGQERTVRDVEDSIPAAVEIARVDFNHGEKRVSVRAKFSYLSEYTEYYRLELRGPRGRAWSVGWGHESQDWSNRKRVKWIYLFKPDFRRLPCKSKLRWHENLDAGVVRASFPTRCLRIQHKPVRWLKMQFSADDFYEESHLEDWAPGGNTTNGLPGRFTVRLKRG